MAYHSHKLYPEVQDFSIIQEIHKPRFLFQCVVASHQLVSKQNQNIFMLAVQGYHKSFSNNIVFTVTSYFCRVGTLQV